MIDAVAQPPRNPRQAWHREILATALRHAWLLGLCREGESMISNLPAGVQHPLVEKMTELLDRACEAQESGAFSEQLIGQQLNASLWNFLLPHRARSFNQSIFLEQHK